MTITPEKLRELADDTEASLMQIHAYALRAAADEIERLQKPHWSDGIVSKISEVQYDWKSIDFANTKVKP